MKSKEFVTLACVVVVVVFAFSVVIYGIKGMFVTVKGDSDLNSPLIEEKVISTGNKIESTVVKKQWITFEDAQFPTYYNSHRELEHTWTDGSKTMETYVHRGTLTWNLAPSYIQYVTQAQLNSLVAVTPATSANSISVGSNLQKMTSSVTVADAPTGFLKPSFTWTQTKNTISAISTWNLVSSRENIASVKATSGTLSTPNHISVYTFRHTYGKNEIMEKETIN